MATQKEMLEAIIADQKNQGELLRDIDTCLRGPEYDPSDGGLVAEVHTNTNGIKTIKRKQTKIITWGVTIVGAINLAGIIFFIVKQLR